MKKLILSLLLLALFGWTYGQDCSDLIISEYVEGWSNNKALEIYNPTPNEVTLTGNYRLIRWSNGDDAADLDIRYVLPLEGSIPAYQVIVMIQDTNFPGQDTMIFPGLRQKANYMAPADYDAGTNGCRVVFWNGDDAVSLQRKISESWVDIDILGEIGVKPALAGFPSQLCGWDDTPPYADGQGNYLTLNQTLKRKSNVKVGINRAEMNMYGVNSFYALDQYDSLPSNAFDSLGFHHCDCQYLSVPENQHPLQVQIYPNPLIGRKVLISADFQMSAIQLFSLDGRLIDQATSNDKQATYLLPEGLENGIYLVRIMDQENRFISRQLILY
jgi:hypothetical protein